MSIVCGARTLTRAVQEQAHFSVEVLCDADYTLHWSFMSGSVSRAIGSWSASGNFTNITADYRGRVRAFENGSMGLCDLRIQDSGFYVLTVTRGAETAETSASSSESQVLYEDLQYLSISALALGCVVALLMFTMWLMDKLYRRLKAWTRRKRLPEADVTELQPL
ncbi:hypothetical protein WMY93_028305 [Mugilogobius chulae]|uniref:Immunoglobulin subtype domain-containing protein n=1 Tax=Mugilogobius chulae TaxID=88201 RepID=A0AAW0MZS2_9GOBI